MYFWISWQFLLETIINTNFLIFILDNHWENIIKVAYLVQMIANNRG